MVRVRQESQISSYSCPEKKDYIVSGLAKFSAESKKSMFDYRARQAQFYKDVEMAEVMTDNDPDVAEILSQYEIVENVEEDQPKPPPKKRRKRRKN